MKRRLLWAAAAMAVVIAMLSLYIAADDTPEASAVVFQAGEIVESDGVKTVTVTVSIQNNPGFVTATIPVKWDPAHLELTAVQNNEEYFACESEDVYTSEEWSDGWHGMALASSPSEDGLYYLAWGYDASFAEKEFNFAEDGVLATLTFKVIADDTVVSTDVQTVEDSDIANLMNWDMEDNWDSLSFVNGRVVLKDGIPGDVNGDNEVTITDATLLLRHVARITTITDVQALANAEVTGDDSLTIADATKILQYVAKIIGSLE